MNCLYNQAHVASMLHSLASHDLHSVPVQEVVCLRWKIRVEVKETTVCMLKTVIADWQLVGHGHWM